MNSKQFSKTKYGFTLVELLVVIAILAILTTVTIIGYSGFIKKAAISNDNLLANKINSLLSGYRISESVNDDNAIAIILQKNIKDNIIVESQKYDMDIYYNVENQKFEVISNSEVKNSNYNTLDYYLNLTTFRINSTYYFESNTIFTPDIGPKESLRAFVNNNALFVTIYQNIDELKTQEIDLSKIISVQDPSGEFTKIEYQCIPKDLIDNVPNDQIIQPNINGTMLTVYTPGLYAVNVLIEGNVKYSFDLYVRNAYFSKSPQINANGVRISLEKDSSNNLTVSLSHLWSGIFIDDYDIKYSYSYEADIALINRREYKNNIVIYIELNGETKEIKLNEIEINNNQQIISSTFNSVDLSQDNTISITYRYQGNSGSYCYSEEKILTIE